MMHTLKASILSLLLNGCSGSDFAGGGSTSASGGQKPSKTSGGNPDDEKETDQADEPVQVAGSQTVELGGLRIEPKELTLFKGDKGSFKLLETSEAGDETDRTDDADWTNGEPVRAKSLGDGRVEAVDVGEGHIKAVLGERVAKALVHVVKCLNKTMSATQSAATVKIDGENWPGNSVDPGGGDKDDYHVTIAGSFLVDGFQLFVKEDQKIHVTYSLGTPGSTTQVVKLALIDCDGAIVSNEEVSSGSGSHDFEAKKGQRFTLVTTAKTGAATREFRLDQDTSDASAADAFKVTVQ